MSAFTEAALVLEIGRLPTMTFRPFAVWIVAPVAMPTLSGFVAKSKVNCLQGARTNASMIEPSAYCGRH